MTKTIKDLLILSFVLFLITIALWLPHLLASSFYNLKFDRGFPTIYQNYDGLEYVVIAKTFYNPSLIANLPYTLSPNYYAAHFPGYSLAILLLAPVLGMLKSMLFVSLLFTLASSFAFYFLVKDFKLSSKPLFLSIVFLILPARWLVVHSIGSSEPMFIFFVLSSIYFFLKFEYKEKFRFLIFASIFGLAAQITRPPGILLFVAYSIYILWKYFLPFNFKYLKQSILKSLKYYPLLLIPAGLAAIFYLYQIRYGDFWAYFHSGDNIHLTFPPFQVFNNAQPWVGDMWLEDIVLVYLLGLLGGLWLIRNKLYLMSFFVLTYLGASMFVAHRDISRYSLPIFPFVLIAFEKVLISKEFRIVLAIAGLGVYLYAQNFILNNTAPIPNLSIYN